jgi:hypothetical protein
MSQYHKYFRLSSCIVNYKMDHLLRVVVGGGGGHPSSLNFASGWPLAVSLKDKGINF